MTDIYSQRSADYEAGSDVTQEVFLQINCIGQFLGKR
nr:hypothetical protein [Tannerella forsythia]